MIGFWCIYLLYVFGQAVTISENEILENDILRALGGAPTAIEEHPYVAQFINLGSMCAATILGSKLLLTAAHCFNNNQYVGEMHILVGAHHLLEENTQMHIVWDFIVHEDYTPEVLHRCDLALIFIEGTLRFGPKVQKTVLVDTHVWMNENETNFIAVGWGSTKGKEMVNNYGLLKTPMRFVSLTHCMAVRKETLTQDVFCMYGRGESDKCRGDSGGGILWKGMLVGVVSHGDGCSEQHNPSVYVNVLAFRSWIESRWLAFRNQYCPEVGL